MFLWFNLKCDLQHKDQPKRRGLAFSYRVCSVLYSQGVQRYLLYSSKCTILSRNTCALLVMSGMWMPFESNHPPRHSCRPSTPPHGNSTLQSVAPPPRQWPHKNWNATERPESSKRRPQRQRVQSDRSSACEIRSDRWRPQVPKGSTAARLPSRRDTSTLSPSTFSVFLLSLSPESGCLPAQILIPKHQQITFSYK